MLGLGIDGALAISSGFSGAYAQPVTMLPVWRRTDRGWSAIMPGKARVSPPISRAVAIGPRGGAARGAMNKV